MSKKDHNPRHRLFALSYARTGIIQQAAIEAGYSPKSACRQGLQLLQKPEVLALVDAELEEIRKAQLRVIVRHTKTAINRLVREVTEGKPGSMAAVQAANSILDRAGIPVQTRQEISGPDGGHVGLGIVVLPAKYKTADEWVEAQQTKEIPSKGTE